MGPYPLAFTVEHDELIDFSTSKLADYAVIKLNGYQVAKIELDHYHLTDQREHLELAAVDFLSRLFKYGENANV